MFSCDVGRRKPHVIEEVCQHASIVKANMVGWLTAMENLCKCLPFRQRAPWLSIFLQKTKEQHTLILCDEPGCLHPPLNFSAFAIYRITHSFYFLTLWPFTLRFPHHITMCMTTLQLRESA
jgi:hypothetical protein